MFFINLSSDGAGGEVDAVLEGGLALVVEEGEGVVVLEVDVVQEFVAILVDADGLAPDQDVILIGLGVCYNHSVVPDVEHCGGETLGTVLVAGSGGLEAGDQGTLLIKGAEVQARSACLRLGILLQPPGD